MNKSVLITGGNGFIGSEIVKRFVLDGIRPYLILRGKSNRSRIKAYLSKCEVIQCDITNAKKIEGTVKLVRPQVILHLAGSGVDTYTDEEIEGRNSIVDTNVKGTLNLLSAVKTYGCETLINTGSCFEYGSNRKPFTEESICNPTNIYGATKVTATHLATIFYMNYKLPIITLRPFTVYGPGQGEGRFISTVTSCCIKRQNLKLLKETVVRDYIFIDDVVDGYFKAIEFYDKLIGEIINISTGIGSTLEDVAQKIKRLTGALDVSIERGAFHKRSGEVLSLVGDPKKAKRIMGWEAKYTLEEGLKKTIDSALKES